MKIPVKYESMMIDPDSNAGYQAFHEAIQEGWEPIFHWQDDYGNHFAMRRIEEKGNDT